MGLSVGQDSANQFDEMVLRSFAESAYRAVRTLDVREPGALPNQLD